ncbi:MAG: class I SAM-dependent methyltransferase [Thermoleophilia bacterium]
MTRQHPPASHGDPPAPFGVRELLDAAAGAARVLDVGCGSGRLTVALALAGATVTGIDTSDERLAEAGRRAEGAGVELALLRADMDEPLPFPDGAFEAVTSRLSLMVAAAPVTTLRELGRILVPGGRVATVLWASLDENPWFDAPRRAVGAVLGAERASFAGAFGRLGTTGEAADVHRSAGLADVEARLLREVVERRDAAEHWHALAAENGHFRRIDASLDEPTRAAILADLDGRLAGFRQGDALAVPRTLVLVTARRDATGG